MGEIIHLQIGQCGNQIGDKFWSFLQDEHCLDATGAVKSNSPAAATENIDVFFHEFKQNNYVPRALLVDLESGVLDSIRAKSPNLFHPDNFISSNPGAGGNWAKGHYTEGAELVDQVLDVVRKETERADRLQGFQLLHSISGGTGSGMGTLIASKLREEYPDRMLWSYSVVAAARVGSALCNIYNQVLAMHQLIENTDAVVYLEDDAAYSLCWRFKIQMPNHGHLNTLWANVMSDITSGMRFSTQSRTNLRKLTFNLVPFPRAHFLVPARSNISANTFENKKENNTMKEITTQLFDWKNLILENISESDSREEFDIRKHLAANCVFRGNIPIGEIDESIGEMQTKYNSSFVKWIPDNLKSTTCEISPNNSNICSTALINTTAIIDPFKSTASRFHAMFKRKAFLHWYTGEGMDEMEFTEAISNVEDLTAEYQQYQDATVDRNFLYNSDDEVE